MKKFIIPVAVALTVALAMTSCGGSQSSDPNVKTIKANKTSYVNSALHSITPVTFKGHEYLIYDGVESGSMCHSESCPCKNK